MTADDFEPRPITDDDEEKDPMPSIDLRSLQETIDRNRNQTREVITRWVARQVQTTQDSFPKRDIKGNPIRVDRSGSTIGAGAAAVVVEVPPMWNRDP